MRRAPLAAALLAGPLLAVALLSGCSVGTTSAPTATPTPIESTQMSMPGMLAAAMPAANSSESPVTNGMNRPRKSAVPAKTSPHTTR